VCFYLHRACKQTKKYDKDIKIMGDDDVQSESGEGDAVGTQVKGTDRSGSAKSKIINNALSFVFPRLNKDRNNVLDDSVFDDLCNNIISSMEKVRFGENTFECNGVWSAYPLDNLTNYIGVQGGGSNAPKPPSNEGVGGGVPVVSPNVDEEANRGDGFDNGGVQEAPADVSTSELRNELVAQKKKLFGEDMRVIDKLRTFYVFFNTIEENTSIQRAQVVHHIQVMLNMRKYANNVEIKTLYNLVLLKINALFPTMAYEPL
jgi:hypothetical protein